MGAGETYPQFVADEGPKLAAETKAAFLGGQPALPGGKGPDPLAPKDPAAFAKKNPDLTQAVYNRLRRAVIELERSPFADEGQKAVDPSTTPLPECPAGVLAVAPSAFGTPAKK